MKYGSGNSAGSPAGFPLIRIYAPVEVLVETVSRLLLGWADGDPAPRAPSQSAVAPLITVPLSAVRVRGSPGEVSPADPFSLPRGVF